MAACKVAKSGLVLPNAHIPVEANVIKTIMKRIPKWTMSSKPLITVATKTPTRGCALVVCNTLIRFKIMIEKPKLLRLSFDLVGTQQSI